MQLVFLLENIKTWKSNEVGVVVENYVTWFNFNNIYTQKSLNNNKLKWDEKENVEERLTCFQEDDGVEW